MNKQDWFVHATADEEFDVAQYGIAGGEGAVNAPVEKKVNMTKVVEDQGDVQVHGNDGGSAVKVHEGEVMAKNVDNESVDLVPVEEGAKLTKILDKLGSHRPGRM